MDLQKLPHEGIVAIRLPGPLTLAHASSLRDQLEMIKRDQGSRVQFLVLPGSISIESLSDCDLAAAGLQRIAQPEAIAC